MGHTGSFYLFSPQERLGFPLHRVMTTYHRFSAKDPNDGFLFWFLALDHQKNSEKGKEIFLVVLSKMIGKSSGRRRVRKVNV